MRYGEKRMALKDGRICLLRSPGAEDAGAMLDYLRDIAGETHFLIRYPEEVRMDPAEEADFLEQQRRPDSRSVMIAAFMDGVVAGDVSVSPAGGQQKLRHRASLGIAVRQPCWSLGLGRILIRRRWKRRGRWAMRSWNWGCLPTTSGRRHSMSLWAFRNGGGCGTPSG